jgi:branched-chain amino acid aminotransferase
LNNILGKIEATAAGCNEALMLTIDGYVAECTGDNIFIIKNGRLITPPSEIGALNGITQQAVIDIASKKGMKFGYEMLKPNDVFDADECFLTGTAAEVIPVNKVDDKVIGSGAPGPVTGDITRAFRELTRVDGAAY